MLQLLETPVRVEAFFENYWLPGMLTFELCTILSAYKQRTSQLRVSHQAEQGFLKLADKVPGT